MKSAPSSPASRAASAEPRASRRRLVVGAGVAGGAALAAVAVGRGAPQAPVAAAADAPAKAEGYRLTDHVRRYYETTRT